MGNIRDKLHSLYFEMAGLLIAAILIAGMFFVFLSYVGNHIIAERFSDSDYVKRVSRKYMADLQDYIDQEQVASGDAGKLTEWVKRQKIVSIQVYKNEILTYDSNYPDAAVEDAEAEGGYYEWEYYYTAVFSDGTADVFLYGFFAYQFYNWTLIVDILLSVILLVLIVSLGVRSKVRYIKKLKEECQILGNGDMDYQVTVRGRDEIALLASGLDHMRLALKESNEKEAELMAASRRMITEMSHDLRTPLTSLLIYTEILEKKDITDREQLREYVRKIERKARQIKRLSDNIFEYALMTEGKEIKLGDPETFRDIFYDSFSEMTAYLEERGYKIETDMGEEKKKIRVNGEYINRILDNIVSNIIKYAKQGEPVRVRFVSTDQRGMLVFENRICADIYAVQKTEGSTNIGLRNIEKMMESMNGGCTVCQTEDTFRLSLIFPWALERQKKNKKSC